MTDTIAWTEDVQAELRATGLLAQPDEPWSHPAETFHLHPLSTAKRRGRSDGLTASEARRLGLDARGQ
jgi:hypothetical protein